MCMKFYWSGHRGHGRWTMSLICPCPRQITRTLSDDNHMLGHMADADVGQCPNMSTSAIYGADIENVQHCLEALCYISPTFSHVGNQIHLKALAPFSLADNNHTILLLRKRNSHFPEYHSHTTRLV